MTFEHLLRIENTSSLLPEPGAEVVLELTYEIRRLRKLAEAVKSSEFDGHKFEDIDGVNWFDYREAILK